MRCHHHFLYQVTEVKDEPPPNESDAGNGGQPALAGPPTIPPMNAMVPAPAPGMGYHPGGYPMAPPHHGGGYPPQPMMYGMPPHMGGPGGGGGGMPPMMMAPHPSHNPYTAMSGSMAANPPEKKVGRTQVCVVHPDGMPRAFDVPFPERKLPVCDRCKKNFRSRELCRTRDGHKALPWQTTYVVITLTDEVLEEGEDGSLIYADIPVVGELQEMPELCRGPADGSMAGEPICKVCKEKNYTRDHCRNTLKHTTPPYNAAYVKLVKKSSQDDMHPAKKKKKRHEENADGKPAPPDWDNVDNPEGVVSDDLTVIHQSKTFFASISSKKFTVKWCEQIQYPDTGKNASPQAQSGYNNMMQPNMNSQLWDAFRAGAMWHFSQVQQGGHGMPAMPPGYGHGGGNYGPPPGSYAPPSK